MKKATIFFLFLFQFIFISSVFAQTPAITNGLTYLSSTQNPDGSWGTDTSGVEILPSTVSAIETLQLLNQSSTSGYASALVWLQAQGIDTTDYLSERIYALSVSGTDNPLLLSYIDDLTGAWGGYDDFKVNNLDTSLALQALRRINYSDQNVIVSALYYLTSTQNPDGGWGFAQGDDSNVYMTATVLITLSQFPQTTVTSTAINKATGYLVNHANPDGGFGSSPSTVYETALTYMALTSVITDNTVLGGTISYLTSTQASNGSWNDDPYSTALALRAIYFSENRPTPPPPPTSATVTGVVADALSGQPLAGAAVALQSDPAINAATDAAGRFSLSNIPAGTQKVTITATGYLGVTTLTLNIVAGNIYDIGTIRLSHNPATGTIRGTVTDAATGLPLSGVTIAVSGAFTGSTSTAVDGSFVITGVTPGTVTVSATLSGYYTVSGTGVITAGGTLLFNPKLSTTPPSATTGELAGRVLDSLTNMPVAGAVIALAGGPSATSGAQGTFHIIGISPNTYQMTVSAAGYMGQVSQVVIAAGATADTGTVYLAPTLQASTVTGTVTDASTGLPIPNAEVSLAGTSLTARTDAAGSYTITNIYLLEVVLKATVTGYDSKTIRLLTTASGNHTVNFGLNRSLAGALRVVSVTTDKQAYTLTEDVAVLATIENTAPTDASGTVEAEIQDGQGNVIVRIHPAEPNISLAPGQTIQTTLNWNTGQFAPGQYTLVLRVMGPSPAGYPTMPGELMSELAAGFAITESKSLIGALSLTPPVTQVDMQIPIAIKGAVRNTGNAPITTGLRLSVTLNGAEVYTADSAVTDLQVNSVAEMDLGSFIPPQGGSYSVALVPADPATVANIMTTLYVGPHAEATFTVTPERAVAGDAKVAGRIVLKGFPDLSAQTQDPLVPLIKNAIQKGIVWEQTNALAWQNRNNCYGCHLQTQTIIGSELSRGKVVVDDNTTGQLLSFINSCQTPTGAEGHYAGGGVQNPPYFIESTTLYAWALSFYHDGEQVRTNLALASDYLITRQDASGYWASDYYYGTNDWWNDLGSAQPSTPFTAYNITALARSYRLSGSQSHLDAMLKAMNYLTTADHARSIITAAHIVIGLMAGRDLVTDQTSLAAIDAKVGAALSYLRAVQTTDGGWGRYAGDTSDPLPTAHVLYALSSTAYTDNGPSLRNGTTYLLGKQNADGTWSTPFVRRNTYPDRHFAATTWAIISLPVALDAIAGVAGELTIALPSNIALNGSTTAPSNTSTSGSNTVFLWNFNSLTSTAVNLDLDLTMNGLQIGEERMAAVDAYLTFADSYTGNTVRVNVAIPFVRGVPAIEGTVSTDRPAYEANKDVLIGGQVTNLSQYAKTIDVKLTIEDPSGAPVAEVATLQGLNLVASPTVTSNDNAPLSETITLQGEKPGNTSIVINGIEAVPLNSSTTWQARYTLAAGPNTLNIVARSAYGFESLPATFSTTFLRPVTLLRMDGDWKDSSGNGRDGVAYGGIAFHPNAKVGTQAGLFDGVDDYVALGNWFNFQSFTISMWVWPGGLQQQFADIIDNNHSTNRSWVLQQNGAVTNQYCWGVSGNGSSCFSLAPNAWTHIAMTRDDTSRTNMVYINGVPWQSFVGTSSVIYGSQFLSLGKWGGGRRNWSGLMDNVAIHDSALSADQIRGIFDAASGVSPTTVPVSPVTIPFGSLLWNTGSTAAGAYRVHARFYENGTLLAESIAPFNILPDLRAGSRIAPDRVSYTANRPVVLASSVTGEGANAIFGNLTARIAISGQSANILYTETQNIQTLVPGQIVELKSYWNTRTNPPGIYPVTLEVRDSAGQIITSSSTTLTISSDITPSALLKGTISVDKQSLLQGEPVNITYNVSNVGNMDLPDINLSILTVHVVTQGVYDTLIDHASLLMGQIHSNSQILQTTAYTAKDYLVVLRASVGGVEETLAGTYFRVEGAPSAPSLNAPQHGQDVLTLTPTLIVNNASDPNDDKLTYEFELYTDSGLTALVASASALSETAGSTSWLLPISLQENSTYHWRARAYDGRLYGDWMLPASFRVNIANDPPTAPKLSSPADGSQVGTLTPVLAVNNATDPDSINLTYNFDLSLDANFTQIVSSTTGVFEGAGSTSWQVPVTLNDNTYYYWRAQADDWLTTGPWMTTAKFFVNTVNDPPTAPVIIAPLNNAEVTTLSTDITVSNSTDPDSPVLTYLFELDTVETFDSPGIARSGNVPEGQAATSWNVNGLIDHTFYYVRAKANDAQADSPWSQIVGFFVNTANEAPTVPLLANPSDGGAVNIFSPTLSIHNSSDIDRDVLTYEFELYGDAAMTNRVANATNVPETPQITSWTVPVNLTENNIYYWRARAFDGELYSGWMPLASFMVNTANDAPGAPTLNSPATGTALATLAPTLAVNNATDPDSDTLTYDFEVYSGGVLVTTITGVPQNAAGITSVTLTQALADNTTYTWRSRAYDGDRYGAWMDMATFSIHIPSTSITASIEIEPETLKRTSNGKWITVEIELPHGYSVADIDIASIRLEGTVHAELWPYRIDHDDHDDHCGDRERHRELKVKFKRSEVLKVLPDGHHVRVHVTGTVGTTTFEGVDHIKVMP